MLSRLIVFVLLCTTLASTTRVEINNYCQQQLFIIEKTSDGTTIPLCNLPCGFSYYKDYTKADTWHEFQNGYAYNATIAGITIHPSYLNSKDTYAIRTKNGFDLPLQMLSNSGGPTFSCTDLNCPDSWDNDGSKNGITNTGGVITINYCSYSPPTCKPTTCKPTTCKPTTCKPTTCKPTTCKPTTCKPTTCKPTTTTTHNITQTPTPKSSTFTPCHKRIAFAFDDSSANIYFNAANTFLVNHIFDNGTWTHLERLGLLWYSNQNDKNVSFDVLNDKKHLDLAYVRQLIRNKPVKSSSTSDLIAALQYLAANFPPSDDYDEVFYVVFVSQKLDQHTVDAAQQFADALTNNGRLILIGLGDVGKEELYDLSPYSTIWDDPNNNPVLPDWQHFFWVTAYGCGEELEQFAWSNEEKLSTLQ